MTQIQEYLFDLSSPVYLIHPSNKFWEASISGVSVTYRCGKLKDDVESSEELVSKDYSSSLLAETTVAKKIDDKLHKGYISKVAKKVQKKQQKKEDKIIKKETIKTKSFSGDYYEKGDEATKLEINNKSIKITRISKKKQKSQIRHFDSNKEAVDYCLKEQQWLKSEGYKAMNHKFIYSFVQAVDAPQPNKKTTKKKADTNTLSITAMTDDAMSHRSRNVSETKSDRSFTSSHSNNNYMNTSAKLGNPTSECIKVLLAEQWKQNAEPEGWIMSEKLDGVRCYWTGTTMFSRNANRFYFPKFFTKGWPNSPLDGQLFIGRGQFSKTLSAVKKNVPIDSEWQNVRYLVFDCPALKKPFKQRIKALQQVLGQIDNPYIKCHAHRQCKGFTDLFAELDEVNKKEGEGLMLRDPQSAYENRRSSSLLKVKTFHDDEAEVLGFKPGTGRCQGMVGAIRCRNTHGVQFEVGSGLTDADRRKPPKIGSKITYKYQEFNKDSGKPRFPTYVRPFDKI